MTVAFVPCKDLVVAEVGRRLVHPHLRLERREDRRRARRCASRRAPPPSRTRSPPRAALRSTPASPSRARSRVTNPNAAAVTATIVDTLPGATCQVAGSVDRARRRDGAGALHVHLRVEARPARSSTTSSCSWPRAGLARRHGGRRRPAGDVRDAVDGRARLGAGARRLQRRPGRVARHLQPGDVHLPAHEDGRPALDADLQRGLEHGAIVRDGSSTLDTSTVGSSICRTAENLVGHEDRRPDLRPPLRLDAGEGRRPDRPSSPTDATATFTYTVARHARAPPSTATTASPARSACVNSNTYAITGADDHRRGLERRHLRRGQRHAAARSRPAAPSPSTTRAPGPARRPRANGANRATVSYLPYGCAAAGTGACAPVSATMEPQPFSFARPDVRQPRRGRRDRHVRRHAGRPRGRPHRVEDLHLPRTVPLDGLAAGACLEKANVARVTATDDAGYVAAPPSRTVKVCRPEAPTPPEHADRRRRPRRRPAADAASTVVAGRRPRHGLDAHGASSTTVALTKVAAKPHGRRRPRGHLHHQAAQHRQVQPAATVRVCDALPGTMTYVSAPGRDVQQGQGLLVARHAAPGQAAHLQDHGAASTCGAGVGRPATRRR